MKKRILIPMLAVMSLMSVACEAAYPPRCESVALQAANGVLDVNFPGATVANANTVLIPTGNDYQSETWEITFSDNFQQPIGATYRVLAEYDPYGRCFVSKVEAL